MPVKIDNAVDLLQQYSAQQRHNALDPALFQLQLQLQLQVERRLAQELTQQ
jgi:hypothetical protein